MRILIALSNKVHASWLSSIFAETGAVTEIVDSNNHDLMGHYTRHPDAPFDLVIHEQGAAIAPTKKISARLTFNPHPSAPAQSLQTIHTNDNNLCVLRKAYTAIALSKNFSANSILELGPLKLDLWHSAVTVNETPVKTTPLEYKVLRTLCLNRGQSIKLQDLACHLYSHDAVVADPTNVIRQTVHYLRKKLSAANGGNDLIVSRLHRGYMIQSSELRPLITEFTLGPFTLIPAKGDLVFGDKVRQVTILEAQLAQTLVTKQHNTHSTLARTLNMNKDTVCVHLSRLRRKMVDMAGFHHIETVHKKHIRVSASPIYPRPSKPVPEAP